VDEHEPAIPPALLGPNGIARRGLSRRHLFRGAGMAGAAALLAACGVKGTNAGGTSAATTAPAATSTAATTSAATSAANSAGSASSSATGSASASSAVPAVPTVPDMSDTDKSLNWSNWPEYLDIDENDPNVHPSLAEFEKQFGIKVAYTEDVNDNDQYFAKIQPQLAAGQAISADVFVVTDWMADKLIRLGYLQPIDHANVPNLKNINPNLMDVPFDKGRQYSITWQSGLTGIAYNPAITGGKIESIDQLLTDPKLKGKVTLLTEMRDTVGLTLLDMGFDPANFTDDQFDQAIAKLQSAVDSGQIRSFTGNDYGQGLASGDIAAAIAWTGDVVQLKADNPDLEYLLPTKGSMLWSDNFVIPVLTPHKTNAEKLINFYYDPAPAALVADYVNYITPVQGVKEILVKSDPEVANNQLIFPSEETLNNAHVFMGLTTAQEQRYNAAFAKLSGN
jgi:spermidine/putrescine transport system substrate-binding protein